MRRTTYETELISPISPRKMGFYERYIKRLLDIVCSLIAIVILSPVFLVVAIMVRVNLGAPILFCQDRPGMINFKGKEVIFKMRKFRTMTDAKDCEGNLLPDDKRMTPFGSWLRKTSLDELPELFNIIEGTMSIVGPRPQLVRDMVFMTEEQRKRHTAKPGLTGLAQVNGRNSITWENKLSWDLRYIERVSFAKDISIIGRTISTALIKQEGISEENMATAEDLGDYLLRIGCISTSFYGEKNRVAKAILNGEKTSD